MVHVNALRISWYRYGEHNSVNVIFLKKIIETIRVSCVICDTGQYITVNIEGEGGVRSHMGLKVTL